jgi:hypothetical protein
MKELYKTIPDDIIITILNDTASITVNCNTKSKLVRKKIDTNRYNYEDYYEAETNSFTVDIDDIDLNDLVHNPSAYLNK